LLEEQNKEGVVIGAVVIGAATRAILGKKRCARIEDALGKALAIVRLTECRDAIAEVKMSDTGRKIVGRVSISGPSGPLGPKWFSLSRFEAGTRSGAAEVAQDRAFQIKDTFVREAKLLPRPRSVPMYAAKREFRPW
jgi:hypothetical protein